MHPFSTEQLYNLPKYMWNNSCRQEPPLPPTLRDQHCSSPHGPFRPEAHTLDRTNRTQLDPRPDPAQYMTEVPVVWLSMSGLISTPMGLCASERVG